MIAIGPLAPAFDVTDGAQQVARAGQGNLDDEAGMIATLELEMPPGPPSVHGRFLAVGARPRIFRSDVRDKTLGESWDDLLLSWPAASQPVYGARALVKQS